MKQNTTMNQNKNRVSVLVELKRVLAAFLVLAFFSALSAGEYTRRFNIKVKAQGESLTGDPVESFNSAIDYAQQAGEVAGEGIIKGEASAEDAVLNEVWVKKKANLQVVDLEVLDYKFNPPRPDGNLITDVHVDLTMEYLNVPKFVEDYTKTLSGATFRSMAIPGWGQLYNRQYVTSFLYGTFFWAFYGLFIGAMKGAVTQDERDSAFASFQVPAMIFWIFNVSEAWTSRFLGKQGLENLRSAYRLTDFDPKYERKTERGIKVDFVLFEVPLYRLWRKE